MKQKLVRINSADGIEQPGILYSPDEKTNKIVIHVHGLNGNFYENRFLDTLAEVYTAKGHAFLTFNNRGKDFIAELSKNNEPIVIGGSLERFEDCVLDIEGVVAWAKSMDYSEITLEGHSYGCNKVLYYYNREKDPMIKKIILLAPCDIPSECKKYLSEEEYNSAKDISTKLVREGEGRELIDFSIMANGKIAADTYYYDFLPGGKNDFIRYSDGTDGRSPVLRSVDVSVLVVFGDSDDFVLTQPIDTVKGYLSNNLSNCTIRTIVGTGHDYTGKYDELGEIIRSNI